MYRVIRIPATGVYEWEVEEEKGEVVSFAALNVRKVTACLTFYFSRCSPTTTCVQCGRFEGACRHIWSNTPDVRSAQLIWKCSLGCVAVVAVSRDGCSTIHAVDALVLGCTTSGQ